MEEAKKKITPIKLPPEVVTTDARKQEDGKAAKNSPKVNHRDFSDSFDGEEVKLR
jgi:hypothetical protein